MTIAQLLQPYTVYLALYDYDVEVTLPVGTDFELLTRVKDDYIGFFRHPEYGEFAVQTPDAFQLNG
jgi:hypothetical protein